MSVRSRVFVGARRVWVLVAVIVTAATFPTLIAAGPSAASGPTIQFSGTYTSTLGTHSLTLTWSTNTQPSYCSIYIFETVGCEAPSGSKTIALSGGGRNSYNLYAAINGAANTQPLSVDVPVPSPPTLKPNGQGTDATQMSVDMFSYKEIHTQAQPTLYWTSGGSSAAPTTELQVGRPNSQGQMTWGPWQVESGTSYPIPQSDLTTQTTTYQLRSCDTTGSPLFCSSNVVAKVSLVGAQPVCPTAATTCTQGTASYRDDVPSGGSTTIGWDNPTATTPGNFWDVAYQTLQPSNGPVGGGITTNQTFSVPTQQAGVVDVWLESCDLTSFNPPAATCGPSTPVTAPVSGTVTSLMPANEHVLALGSLTTVVATITDSNNVAHQVQTTASGILNSVNPAITQGQSVTQGQVLFNVATQVTEEELVAGSTASWQFKPYTSDFENANSQAYPLWIDGRVGGPTDAVFNPQGNIFMNSEFSQAMAEVDPLSSATPSVLKNAQDVTVHDVPLNRTFNSQSGLFQQTQPFENGFAPSGNTNTSELGEQTTISGDGRIWFTQGGWSCSGPCGRWNHSRIVSFNPNATADPTQVDDSRYCAYSVPGNDNQIMGIAWDGSRIWYTEDGTGALDWFDPTQVSCDTQLDYSQSDPNNPMNVKGAHTFCPANTTTGNCVHQIPSCTNPAMVSPCIPASVGLAELTFDPNGPNGTPSIWYSTIYNGTLGEVDINPSTGAVCSTCVTSYPLPAPVHHFVLPGPWQIRADQNHVYVAEFLDGDIIRFDKATKSIPAGDAGELHVPLQTSGGTTFSLGLYGGRLYFTAPGDLTDGSGLGYIDLNSWNAGTPQGVIYTGIGSLTDPLRAQLATASTNTISIDQNTGSIALGDYSRQQVLVLAHNPSTNVIIPSSGATISGTPVLDALASDNASVTQVQFFLSGGTLNHQLIGTATPTYYGWINNSWNSASVPNGTYTLQSVASDSAGNVGSSDGITVTISN